MLWTETRQKQKLDQFMYKRKLILKLFLKAEIDVRKTTCFYVSSTIKIVFNLFPSLSYKACSYLSSRPRPLSSILNCFRHDCNLRCEKLIATQLIFDLFIFRKCVYKLLSIKNLLNIHSIVITTSKSSWFNILARMHL